MMEIIAVWWAYYLMGYVGMAIDLLDDAPKEWQAVKRYVLDQMRDLIIGVLCYNVLVFIWISSGFEFFGFVKGVPNGSIVFLGFAAKYVFGAAARNFKKQVDKLDQEGAG